ncbi:hypothetical protein BKI49_00610 [Streptomyces sp. Tue6028]|nr:hypothetical protein BKI49_00610 [Streptomyces sp. Tue6028]
MSPGDAAAAPTGGSDRVRRPSPEAVSLPAASEDAGASPPIAEDAGADSGKGRRGSQTAAGASGTPSGGEGAGRAGRPTSGNASGATPALGVAGRASPSTAGGTDSPSEPVAGRVGDRFTAVPGAPA